MAIRASTLSLQVCGSASPFCPFADLVAAAIDEPPTDPKNCYISALAVLNNEASPWPACPEPEDQKQCLRPNRGLASCYCVWELGHGRPRSFLVDPRIRWNR